MEMGDRKKIDYSKYVVRKFVPHLFNETLYGMAGCGKALLALVSGKNPYLIKNTNKENLNDFKDSFVINFLRRESFKVIPIKQLEITNLDNYDNPITRDHVLMVSQLYTKKDSSWAIIYNDRYFHNFQISQLTNFEFINRPILTAYILFHEKWVK